jgi:cobalamin biosynthesis Mg chelatase CobN
MARPNSMPPEPGPDAGVDDIQADIERTRTQLGDTVGALSAKLDVKERTKQKATETKERVVDSAHTVGRIATHDPKVKMPLIAVLVLGALVGVVVWRRRR